MTPKQFRLVSELVEKSFNENREFSVVLDSEKLTVTNKPEPFWASLLYVSFLVIGLPLAIVLLSESQGVRILGVLVSLIFLFRCIQFFNFDREVIIDFKSKRIISKNMSVLKFLLKSRSISFNDVSDFKVKTIFYQKWMPTTKGVYINPKKGKIVPIASSSSTYLIGRLQHLIRLAVLE